MDGGPPDVPSISGGGGGATPPPDDISCVRDDDADGRCPLDVFTGAPLAADDVAVLPGERDTLGGTPPPTVDVVDGLGDISCDGA